MDYKVGDKLYSVSYQDLRNRYNEALILSDKEFMAKLPEMTHLACVICWFKELQTEWILRDDGILHELIHLAHIPNTPGVELKAIRKLFKQQLELK